jgi:predicted Ser/Thr protein kinase
VDTETNQPAADEVAGHSTGIWSGLAGNRERLDRLDRTVLVLGRWSKADVCLLECEGHKAVFKDYRRKSWPVRWLGAWQLAREERAYSKLAGLPGIPRSYGQPDRWSILLEYIEGDRLSALRTNEQYDMGALLTELQQVIETMQAAGLTHNDLRCRENILVRERDHRIFLIDFSGALNFPIGSLRRLLFFPLARMVDRGAWLKWKVHLLPDKLTDEERAEFRRSEAIRRLWFINRHKRKDI